MSDAKPQADYARFDGAAEFQQAVDRLLAQDGRELGIFDPDLGALKLNEPSRVALLEAFLRTSRTRRLQVAVHDTDHLTKHCPRMMELLRRFNHAIQIHRTHQEIRSVQDAFLVLDANHYVRRPVATFLRGAIGLNDETDALAMRARFREIWAASYPAVSSATSGL